MKKFICILLCIILLGLLPACKNEVDEKKIGTSSMKPNETPGDELTSTDSGSDNAPQLSIAPREPLPNPSVITTVNGIPVSEINAKWAWELSRDATGNSIEGFVEEFESGDFVLLEGTGIMPLFSWMDDVLSEYPTEGPSEGILKKDYDPLKIYRYTSEGILLWEKTYSGLSNAIHKAFPLSDGSLLVVTYRDFLVINSVNAEFGGDLTKISPDGEILWSRKLTQNDSYLDEFFEAENGEFYAFGQYDYHSGLIEDKDSAKGAWSWVEDKAASRPTITRYDSEGNVLATCLPDIVFSHWPDGSISSHSNAAYRQGVGLLCDLGTKLICYDENFKVKWSTEEYPNVNTRAREDYPDSVYRALTDMTIQSDGITITVYNYNGNKFRELRFSFEGKKLGKKAVNLNQTSDERDTYSLPDGRKVVMDTFEKKKNRMVLSFEKNGKLTEFDAFETSLSPSYDFPLTPTADGGFFIRYWDSINDAGFETNYYVLTKYNAQGRTEIQRIYLAGQRPIPLKSGLIVLLWEETGGN